MDRETLAGHNVCYPIFFHQTHSMAICSSSSVQCHASFVWTIYFAAKIQKCVIRQQNSHRFNLNRFTWKLTSNVVHAAVAYRASEPLSDPCLDLVKKPLLKRNITDIIIHHLLQQMM